MRFISYAQEMEDFILHVVLQDVTCGFYIDVGAYDPLEISVTKFFYDLGWSGINIEPLRSKCTLFDQERKRDINLCIGLGNERGKKSLTTAGAASTFSDEVVSKRGFYQHNKWSKTMLTLSDIYEQYCKKGQEIHFCKIDVEGYEKEVLEGVTNWDIFRPWVFVMESTEPGTVIPSYQKWENILMDNGYVFAYKTNIERYYLDERKNHLIDRFSQMNEYIKEYELYQIKMEKRKM